MIDLQEPCFKLISAIIINKLIHTWRDKKVEIIFKNLNIQISSSRSRKKNC